jgi:hypothetical protein
VDSYFKNSIFNGIVEWIVCIFQVINKWIVASKLAFFKGIVKWIVRIFKGIIKCIVTPK